MALLTIDIDLPEGVTITGYHRLPNGHGIEVTWGLPSVCVCPRCRHEEPLRLNEQVHPSKMRIVRDLDLHGVASFFCYQAAYHRCSRCDHRQDLLPTFKRKDTGYTYRFEQWVVQLMVGSTETEVARRLGISAETVRHILQHQLLEQRAFTVDPRRVITDVGLDEISLKKRHKLYVTILTDLTDPGQPQVLAVASGKDEQAAKTCLERLSKEQRAQVQRYRVDMGAAYNKACGDLLPNAQGVIDRFHVAKLFGEAVDRERKKKSRQLFVRG